MFVKFMTKVFCTYIGGDEVVRNQRKREVTHVKSTRSHAIKTSLIWEKSRRSGHSLETTEICSNRLAVDPYIELTDNSI